MSFTMKISLITLIICIISMEATISQDIPALQGSFCLESNVLYDFDMTKFEFSWKMNGLKKYYEISKTLERPLIIARSIAFSPPNQIGYTANITFNLPLKDAKGTSKLGSRTTLILIKRNGEKVDLREEKLIEFEAEVWLNSDKGKVTTGPAVGDKGYNQEIDFNTYYKINATDLERVLGVGSNEERPVDFVVILRQYKLPSAISTRDTGRQCSN